MFSFKEFSILDSLKLPLTKLVPIALVSGSILFLPTNVLDRLYLSSFRDTYGFVIGIVFLISTALSIQELSVKVYKKYEEKIYKRKFKKLQPDILRKLSLEEIVLVGLIESTPNKTVYLPINDGIIKRLESKAIIAKTTTTVLSYDGENPKFPYTINPWVVETLADNTDIDEFYEKKCNENQQKVEAFLECLELEDEYDDFYDIRNTF